MYYLSLPKDIYISDTPPSDGSTLFWIKDTTKNAFIARGPRIPEVSSKLSANHFQTRIVGSDLLSVWQFDEAPEVMIYDTVVDNWISYNATAGGDLVPSCLSWSVSNSKVEIVSCDQAYAGKVTVPAFIDGMPVTSIGMACFQGCEQITDIILPDTICKLSDGCFVGCTNLTKIVVPDTITSIGYDPTYYSPNIAFSTYGYFKYLGTEASPYLYCFGFVTDVPENADCVLHSDTTLIARGCFQNDGQPPINTLRVPGKLGIIPEYCFGSCNMKSVVLEDGITSISAYAFSDCARLEQIDLPNSLRTIGNYAFTYCQSLQQFVCPADLISLGDGVFVSCAALTKVVFSDSLQKLEGQIFYECTSLQEVVVGKSLCYGLEYCGLQNCPITSIIISDENTSYSVDSYGVLYNKAKTLIYCALNKQLGNYQMPNTVEEIERAAFEACTFDSIVASKMLKKINPYAFCDAAIQNITLFAGLETIDDSAFYYCRQLTNIELPEHVSVGMSAFEGSAITEIIIPSSVSLGSSAFSSSSLQTVTFEPGCTEVPNNCFNYCMSLKTVNLPNTITTIKSGAFSFCTGLTNIVLPDSVIFIDPSAFSKTGGLRYCITCKDYAGGRYIGPSNNPYWLLISLNTTNTTLQLHEDTKVLGSYCCEKCINITDITIPNRVTLGDYVFSGCTRLESAVIEEGIIDENVGSGLFSGCTKLSSVTLPSSLTTITSSMFYGCTSLTSLPLSNNITTLKYQAFSGCTGLAQITLPGSVTTLANEVFKSCTGLTTATIPDSVTTIGTSTFYGCSKLSKVTLPSGMTSVPNSLFYSCTDLKAITLPNTVTRLENSVFSNSGLTAITLPANVTYIGSSCFYRCSSLVSITLNEGLEHINNSAFRDCSNLTSIKIPKSIKKFNSGLNIAMFEDIFYSCSRLANIYVPFSPDSELALRAPWGAYKATVHYNYVD